MNLIDVIREDQALHRNAELRAGQWISATGAIGSVLAFEPHAIAACFCLGAACFAVYTIVRMIPQGRAKDVAVEAAMWLTLLVPGVIMIVIGAYLGLELAFALWMPPLIVAVVIAMSASRLEPWRPMAYAVVACAVYVATWLWCTRNMTFAAMERSVVLAWEAVAFRTLGFLGAGVSFAAVARGMRVALTRVEKTARQRDLFGKYRIGNPIAAGGMASVVKASYCPDGGFERPVAIKRMHPHLAGNAAFVDAFRREAEIGARLAHPNVVAVLDFGRVDDMWFMAMEHVDGADLGRLLRGLRQRRRRLPPHLAGLIAYEVLQGLAYAHGGARDKDGRLLRVVHRDLSPANVLIARTGDVKVTDFGIACTLHDDEQQHHTQRVIGSMAYLAPEQTKRGAFDHRADVYAVGVLLWEMLAGRRLWKRPSTALTLAAIGTEEAPLLQWLGLDAAWDAVLARALAKSPDDRYESARTMADAVAVVVAATRGSMPHPDELAAFVSSLAAPSSSSSSAAAAPGASDSLSSLGDPLNEAATEPMTMSCAGARLDDDDDDDGDDDDVRPAVTNTDNPTYARPRFDGARARIDGAVVVTHDPDDVVTPTDAAPFGSSVRRIAC